MAGWTSKRLAAVLTTGALVFLGACNDDPTTPGLQADLSQAEIAEINLAFDDDADISFGALFHVGSVNAFDFPSPALLGPPGPYDRFGPVLACLVLEPQPPEDPDADGVPTLFTVRFDPDPCNFRLGVTTLQFSGKLTVSDPVPDMAGYDMHEVLEAFSVAHVLANGRARAVSRTGTRLVEHATDRLIASERLVTSHTTPGRAHKDATAAWQLTFGGDDDIVFDQPVPSGALTLQGSWTFGGRAGERFFDVTTVTPLRYDATCADVRPMLRFTDGVIQKTLIRNGAPVAVITMTWTGCGERPTREVVRTAGSTDRPRRR